MENSQRKAAFSWLASGAAGAILAASVSFPWGRSDTFDPVAVIAFVLLKVEQAYVSPVVGRELTEKTLAHLAESLDEWSAYIPPGEFDEFDEEAEGRFGGIGVLFDGRGGSFFIAAVLAGGPASRAGIVPGDELLRSDGVELRGRREEEVKRQIRGLPGTAIQLDVRSPDGVERSLSAVREIIHDPSVHRVALLSRDPPIGHVRIERFQRDTQAELDRAFEGLVDAGIEGVVIDLRENPGGLYNEAVAVADRFLDEGIIVSTKGREDDGQRPLWATKGREYPAVRLAILVNARTASAAEIVAAALRDHEKAVVIGEPTYGKCSVQSVIQIFGEGAVWGALKLTTKQYFRPRGDSFSQGGLRPDQEVKEEPEAMKRLIARWREELWSSWSDPTRLRGELLSAEGDASLSQALSILKAAEPYDRLLEAKPGPG